MRPLFLLLSAFLLAACTDTPTPDPDPLVPQPPLTNAADSLAWRITEAAGGLDAWATLSQLRFDWAVVRDSAEVFRAKHWWDRSTGRYRIEYPLGEDSMLVALFDAWTFTADAPRGLAALNGVTLDSTEAAPYLADAYERYINDSYWLLAPLKLFDPGAQRALAPDSSDAETDVLLLTFDNVGLTPGDRYWLRADSTGRLLTWSFTLEGGGQGFYPWAEYADLPTPGGTLHLARRKGTAARAILTEVFPADTLRSDQFDAPNPFL